MTCYQCHRQSAVKHSANGSTRSGRRRVKIEYLGARAITLVSTASFASYSFSRAPADRVQAVEAVDAELMLKRRDFRKYVT